MGITADKLNYLIATKEAIKNAIVAKGVSVANTDTFRSYADKIGQIQSGGGGDTPSASKWTGHADAEGLRAIGWTEEDIAYYQQNGVNWNEEDDEYHKVTDDNKALYGVLTADNISSYIERIVYLPKIDTSNVTNMNNMFYNCHSLVSIPQLNTSSVTSMNGMFYNCHSLKCIPQLDTAKVTNMASMFYYCHSLLRIPQLNTANVTNISQMFAYCYSLVDVPQLDTSNMTNMSHMFYYCYSLVRISKLNTAKVTSVNDMFKYCYSLVSVNLQNAKLSYQFNSNFLSKESLLYLINNEATTSAITIALPSHAYERLANDEDIVAALANHPNITLKK